MSLLTMRDVVRSFLLNGRKPLPEDAQAWCEYMREVGGDCDPAWQDGFREGAAAVFAIIGMAEAIRQRYPNVCRECGAEEDPYPPQCSRYLCDRCA